MNVRDLSIELRPRSDWEAVDLGTALSRRFYPDLLRIGFRSIGPFYLFAAIVASQIPWLGVLLVWWVKPLLDRFYLFYLSRRIFGQEVTVKETLSNWRDYLFKGSFSLLTWLRFSPGRSMTMAVTDLENLKGAVRSQRRGVISRVGGGIAFLITFGGLVLEVFGLTSLLILGQFFIPPGQGPSFAGWGFWLQEGGMGVQLTFFVVTLCYAGLVLLLEPIYLASGFALYLNSRTSQEAWDVELRFRELAGRLQKTRVKLTSGEEGDEEQPATEISEGTRARELLFPKQGGGVLGLLLLLAVCFFTSVTPSQAKDPQVVAEKVLSDEAFTIYTETYRDPVIKESNSGGMDAPPAIPGIDSLFQLIGILALVLLVAFLVVLIINLIRNRSRVREGKLKKDGNERARPSIVMGMDVTPESLPQDLLGRAKELWRDGQNRLALSLLYRGALTHLITEEEVAIESSDTEYECLGEVEKTASSGLARYFKQLSTQWMKAAYSTDPVASHDFETLCASWPFRTR